MTIEEAFKWVKENYAQVDYIINFKNGDTYFVYYKSKKHNSRDIGWNRIYVGNYSFKKLEQYSINTKVYESDNRNVNEWVKRILEKEYATELRKDKINKILENEISISG